MELKEVIENRRSVRHYNTKKVSHEDLEKILNAGRLAPSAKNRQPWNFIVTQNQTSKEDIANELQIKLGDIGLTTCNVIRDCSALVLVYADIEDELMDIQSVGACVENMVLEAYNLGIGSLWIGYILQIEKYLQEKYQINKKLICAVALGYTDKFPSARPRKELSEMTFWD